MAQNFPGFSKTLCKVSYTLIWKIWLAKSCDERIHRGRVTMFGEFIDCLSYQVNGSFHFSPPAQTLFRASVSAR